MVMTQMGTTFGGGDGSANIGMDMMGFLMETPLLSILHFQESALPMGADEFGRFVSRAGSTDGVVACL